MAEGCYRPDEILNLVGNELHLSLCPTCRSLFDRGQAFLEEVRRTAGPAAAAGAGWKAAEAARVRVNQFFALVPEARGAFLQDAETPTPELVLAYCEQSRNALLKSPNEAQTWLEAGERILHRIPPSESKWRERDRQWAEARVKASRGNLLVFRGSIRQAHALLVEARDAYEAMGEEFQTALAARSMVYTLAKIGKPKDALELCIRANTILFDYGATKERTGLLSGLALVWLALSEPKKAGLIFDHLLALIDPADPFAPTVRRNAILPDVETGRWDSALQKLDSLAADLETGELILEKGRTIRLKGEIQLLMGNPRGALEVLHAAAALLGPLEVGYESAQVNALLGQAHLALGHRQKACDALRAALNYYTAEGFAIDLIHLLELWTNAAEEGQSGASEFAAYRRYWQFVPAQETRRSGPDIQS